MEQKYILFFKIYSLVFETFDSENFFSGVKYTKNIE